MTDYEQDQLMEIEALEAILMDDFKEVASGESGLNTSNRCFQITLTPQDDDDIDLSGSLPVQLAVVFSHTEKYPDEPPLINVKSLRGIQVEDLRALKVKLEEEASENLGMAMIYTLVTSAQEWLNEKYGQKAFSASAEDETEKEEVIVPHGEPVTVETFLAWRERFEAELALEKAKLLPESALSAPKEKKMTGRQWFESGRASAKGAAAAANNESEGEDEEDIDFDDDDFEDDEEDMLEHYLADSSTHSSQRGN
uniref:RWD domain-containing protein n=2 Tax=Kalanchoe fedtschenkoi TaxID=63787 RepID=A0A7N0VI09_KALFE